MTRSASEPGSGSPKRYAPPAELVQMDLVTLEALRTELRKLPARPRLPTVPAE